MHDYAKPVFGCTGFGSIFPIETTGAQTFDTTTEALMGCFSCFPFHLAKAKIINTA